MVESITTLFFKKFCPSFLKCFNTLLLKFFVFIPIKQAGSIPTSDNTEYLPPIYIYVQKILN